MQEYEHEFAEHFYYNPTKIDYISSFWPVRGGSNIAKSIYRVGPRRIECYSIHFVREGSVEIECDSRRMSLKKGDMFCLYPDKSYTYYKPINEQELELSWLAMDGPGLEGMLRLIGFDQANPCLTNKWNSKVQEILNEIFDRMQRENSSRLMSCLELHSLVYKLFSTLVNPDEESDIEIEGWLKICIEYIELHATEGITVQQVAQFAGLNRSYFSTIFTKRVGASPIEYISKVKMNKAKKMLLGTSVSITEVAYTLGYPNLFAFTRAFKKYFSLPPSAYRKEKKSF